MKQNIATSVHNMLTDEIRETKMKEKGSVDETNISNFIKNLNLYTKRTTLATKGESKAE